MEKNIFKNTSGLSSKELWENLNFPKETNIEYDLSEELFFNDDIAIGVYGIEEPLPNNILDKHIKRWDIGKRCGIKIELFTCNEALSNEERADVIKSFFDKASIISTKNWATGNKIVSKYGNIIFNSKYEYVWWEDTELPVGSKYYVEKIGNKYIVWLNSQYNYNDIKTTIDQ